MDRDSIKQQLFDNFLWIFDEKKSKLEDCYARHDEDGSSPDDEVKEIEAQFKKAQDSILLDAIHQGLNGLECQKVMKQVYRMYYI